MFLITIQGLYKVRKFFPFRDIGTLATKTIFFFYPIKRVV